MKKNKLVIAVVMLLISAITLTTASYAWFTMSNTVSANGLSLTAAAPANVQISLTGNEENDADWMTEVDLTAPEFKLRPVSTITALEGSFFEPISNDVLTASGLVNEETEGDIFRAIPNPPSSTTQYYYDIPLYFRTKGTYSIDLTLSGLNVESDELNKAIRVAFLNTDKTGYSAGEDALIFSSTGEAYNAAVDTDELGNFEPFTTADGKLIINVPVNAENPNLYGTKVGITLRIYLEGQDPACVVDNVLNSLALSLTFTGSEVTQ